MWEKPGIDMVFRFGPFQLVPSRQILLRNDQPVKLGGRAFDILHLLVMRAGEQVGKGELIEFAWPDVFVDEHNLKVHVSSLRRVLEDTVPQATYIATVVGRGYQFVARVHSERAEIKPFLPQGDVAGCSLPACPTLIGRQRDIEGIARALDFARLVTLVGAGGVGKTSLAIAVAHTRQEVFPDGVHFADLSSTDDPALVPHIVASCLGLRSDPVDLTGAIVDHLRDRRTLIVLDNCEHVLPVVATVAARLAEAKVNSCVLATSREALAVVGENVQRVDPLGFPDPQAMLTAAGALAYPSVQLFATRAQEAFGYRLTDTDAQAAIRLCAALDGLPLAIEIAVAKLDELSPAELLGSVGRRLKELRNGRDDAHSRHRTLWATLDWSYRLLSVPEATTFRLLSVFAGHFEMTDVAHMARLVQLDPFQTTVALGGLVSKSLLSAELHGEQVCYRLLESARCYAADALSKEPIAHEAHRHHAQLMLTAFEQSIVEWAWLDSNTWRSRFEPRTADLRKALDWCFSDGGDAALGVDLAISAIRFWNERSAVSEQLFQVGRALDRSAAVPNAVLRQAALARSLAYSMTLARKPRVETDRAWGNALALSQRSGSVGGHLSTMYGKALFLIYSGRNSEALAVLDEYLDVAERAGDQASCHDGERLGTLARMHLGKLADVQAKLELLAEDLDRGVPTSSTIRYQEQRYVSIHTTLAFTRWLTGFPKLATSMTDEMIHRLEAVGQWMGQSNILALVALPLALWSGDMERLTCLSRKLRRNLDCENIRLWEPVHRFYAGFADHHAGSPNAADEMRAAVKELTSDRILMRTPMYQGVLADMLLRSDRPSEACREIEIALSLQRQTGEAWCLPELFRIKGLALQMLGETDRSREASHLGLTKARLIGARSLEMRLLVDQAETPSSQGDHGTASSMLVSLWDTLEEKDGTADLERAARLASERKRGVRPRDRVEH